MNRTVFYKGRKESAMMKNIFEKMTIMVCGSTMLHIALEKHFKLKYKNLKYLLPKFRDFREGN